jgi:flagellar biosynthetic protein FlhB
MSQQNPSREDKRLPASERKLQKAKRDGQVARSRDLGHAMLLALSVGSLIAFVSYLTQHGQSLMRTGLRFDAATAFSSEALVSRFAEVAGIGLQIVIPVAVAGLFAAIVSAVIPGGIALSLKPLQPKWERMSPLKGLKRLTSKNHFVDSAKLSLLVMALTLIGGWYTSASFAEVANLIKLPLPKALSEGWQIIGVGAVSLVALLILVAMIDVPMQWFRHRTELKMTFQEAKQENKETDGDPHLRARIRSRQREIGSVRMMANVPSADVIISNPTHYAVALCYDETSDAAPRVVAKGIDHIAMKIRELGHSAGVPQLEAPPLARALYAHVRVDQEVPTVLYGAVAQVLAYVFQLRRASASRNGEIPLPPMNLSVPADLDPANSTAGVT